MNRNTIFYTLGAIIIVSFFALLLWAQNMTDDKKLLTNSYSIKIFKGSDIDSIKLNEGILAIAKSTKKTSGFITPKIMYNNIDFRIPVYGMNNLRMYFDEDMYLYSGRIKDEEKFMNGKSESFKELIKQIKGSDNFNCEEIKIDSIKDDRNFVIDPSLKTTSKNKSFWLSFNELKTYIDSLIVTGEINNGSKINLYICSGTYNNEKTKTVDTIKTLDTAVSKPPINKIKKRVEKFEGSSKSKKITKVSVVKRSITSNNFKIKTNGRSLKGTDKVQVILRKNNSQAFSKKLNKSELKKSSFYISGSNFKNLTHKSSLDLDLVIKINGQTFDNLGEFSIFCNQ